jgi:predicted nucleic acid-binding protein
LLQDAQVKGPLVTDAHLATLATEYGATLCSTDGDFARFPQVRWRNPIATPSHVAEPAVRYAR